MTVQGHALCWPNPYTYYTNVRVEALREKATSAPRIQHTDMSMSVSEHKQANYAMPGMTLANNTPAHVRRPTGGYNPQDHNQNAPNSRIVQYMHESLFKRLAKSSSGINSTSLNFDSCTAHPQDEDTDQPVNYSLKYQDCHGNNKLTSNKNINSSYNHTNNSSNFRPINGM
ncbi:adenomatous polyposis coli protein [Biomphalaria pfeifferi]|uniref:Adenomatous polyposis coli protein n=1 Tax=Biomphalaria pfeifferi TaxID=112525 RepID=A0AAD8C7P4_BIOPF|nr:adenomatous polyposis coli protein [Biomphalaria pfeifferi]